MRHRKFMLAGTLATLLLTASAATAFAGEVTGSGGETRGPANANSFCVFSGLNDDPDAPRVLNFTLAPNGPGGMSQSFGQNVTLGMDPRAFNPGEACGGFSNPFRER